MKHKLIIACFALLAFAAAGRAENLPDFLKRVGTGNANGSDLHTNFHGSVFVGGQTFEMNRDKMVEFWKQQKAAKTELVVDYFKITSKAETSDDKKAVVISVVAKVKVTEKVAGSTMKIESVSHFIVLREPAGAFQMLYLAVPKQVRNASADKK